MGTREIKMTNQEVTEALATCETVDDFKELNEEITGQKAGTVDASTILSKVASNWIGRTEPTQSVDDYCALGVPREIAEKLFADAKEKLADRAPGLHDHGLPVKTVVKMVAGEYVDVDGTPLAKLWVSLAKADVVEHGGIYLDSFRRANLRSGFHVETTEARVLVEASTVGDSLDLRIVVKVGKGQGVQVALWKDVDNEDLSKVVAKLQELGLPFLKADALTFKALVSAGGKRCVAAIQHGLKRTVESAEKAAEAAGFETGHFE